MLIREIRELTCWGSHKTLTANILGLFLNLMAVTLPSAPCVNLVVASVAKTEERSNEEQTRPA